MMDFNAVAVKWQKKWEDEKIFEATISHTKKKFYCLEMFPYPSASFLHMGHVRNYTIGDAIARYKRMQGFNVLYPMGYDSFGLPAENAAKKEHMHPREYTENAIEQIIKYQKQLGLSYDWSRVLASHRPDYYKWNQYFFIRFLERGLVYRKKEAVNYCSLCNTTLADEEVVNGRCWRCDTEVYPNKLDQWFFRTTAYAEQLLDDLKNLKWSERIKSIQENWIGKSQGIMVNFSVDGKNFPIFTTRPDTIFGVTFMVISLEHPKLSEYIEGTEHEKEVKEYIEKSRKAALANDTDFLEKSGIFIGKYAVNPLTNEKVPIYTGNFVVADYATGMIMGVPGHDERDFVFAKKYNIPIKIVISSKENNIEQAFTGEGILVNSGNFSGLKSSEAIIELSSFIEDKGLGKRTVQYKLRDWLISRQRYWGTPIPIIYCPDCGIVPVPEKDLPVLLPEDVSFNEKGNPILTSNTFINTTCPKCGAPAKRETDTMGGFMDSSWYYLRFCSPKNNAVAFDLREAKYWMPVDQYIGGIEHAVGHLIYSRFFTKVLRDMGLLEIDEPFSSLFNQGIVYKDGKRMSKSHGNAVTQDEIAKTYGIDSARLFMLFVSSPEKDFEFTEKGIEGTYRFLRKYASFVEDNLQRFSNDGLTHANDMEKYILSKLNSTIEEVILHMDNFEFNIAIGKIFELFNAIYRHGNEITDSALFDCLQKINLMLAPFTPHICEEINEMLSNKGFVSAAMFPKADDTLIDEMAEAMVAFSEKTISDIRDVLSFIKKEKVLHISLFVSEPWKYDLMEKIKEEMADNSSPSDVIKSIMATDLKKYGNEIIKIIPAIFKDRSKMPMFVLDEETELRALHNSKEQIEKEFNCTIKIEKSADSIESKAKQAMPGRVAIIVE